MSSTPAPKAEPIPGEEADVALRRGVLDAAPARVCVIARDRRYLYVNREFAEFAQRPAEEILRLHTRDLVGEEVAARLDPYADRALAGEVGSLEGCIDYRRNGRRFIAWTFTPFATPFRAESRQRDAFILFMRDLTDQKLREEEAEANRDRLRAILEGIADGVNIVAPDARLVLANPGFLRMFDFPPELGAPGTPLADFVRNRLRRADFRPDEDAGDPEDSLVQRRVDDIMGRPPGRQEETRPDGSIIELRTTRLADGTLVNTYSDLTLQREAERTRRANREALRRNERLSAIASLLGGVAHEINNPLAGILQSAQVIAARLRPDNAANIRAAEKCGCPMPGLQCYIDSREIMTLLDGVRDAGKRLAMFATMAVGCLFIVAMSSWLNAAALAGSAALEQHLAVTLEGYVADLDEAHGNALAAQSLLPDVTRAADRFARLAEDERSSGALTGTTGAGSVVQLLTQMGSQMTELANSISASRDEVAVLFEQGSAHLAKMRELVSAPGAVEPRADQFAAEVVQLTAVIAALQETSVAPSVKRAAADLSLGFIAPVADGGNA